MSFSNKYEQIRLLGEGTYGKAFLVRCIEDKSLAVIKSIDLGNLSEDSKKDAFQEAKILEQLEHTNIIRFIEVIEEKISKTKSILNIVMDYADGGDLSQKIKSQKGKLFPENQIIDWFTQVCLAIKHIHDRKILHRDIKSQNIFLTKNGMVKLGDFGIAKCLNQTIDKAKTIVGTPYYLSPEIINQQPYDFKSDIWSLGVLLYEMCALKMPFDAPNIPQLSMKIINCSYTPLSNIYSKELRTLVHEMLNVNSNRRPTIHEILRKKLIKSRIKNFLSEVEFNKEFSHTLLHNYTVLKAKGNSSHNDENVYSEGNNNKINSKNHQRPVIKGSNGNISNNNNNKKNYHFKDNNINNSNSNYEKDKETIQSKKDKESESKISYLKKNLGCPSEVVQFNPNRISSNNYNHRHLSENERRNINNNNHHNIVNNSGERPKLIKNIIRKENSERVLSKKNLYEKDKDKDPSFGNVPTEGSVKQVSSKDKKTDRSDSRGSKDDKSNLKEFMRDMKKKLAQYPKEESVVWMKGMENFFQYLQSEKEKEQQALKNSEASYKKNIRDLNDYVDSQKMLLEYEQLEKEDITEEDSKKDEDELINGDENYVASYNFNKQMNERDSNKERNMDDIMKSEIDHELGKDMASDFALSIKKYVNDDICYFDYDEIKSKIKNDYAKKNWPTSIVEKAIIKIPDIYYLILKNKL